AAGHQLRAFLLADADVFEVLPELRLVDDRTDVGAGRQRVVDLELRQPVRKRANEAVVNARPDDQSRRGRAALPGRKESAVDRAVDRHPQVGVVQNDQRILAAHFELQLGHALDRLGGDRVARRDRAGEADAVDAPIVDHRLADDAAASHHQVEDAFGHAGVDDDLGQRPGRAWDELGRLEHDAVAVGERRRDLPRGDRNRKIPRRDDADDAYRLAGDLDVDARTDRRNFFACQTQRFAGEKLEDLPGARGFADALGQRLAFFARQQ